MSWRRLQNVLKTSWRCLEDVFARRLEDVLKTYDQDDYVGLDQDVLKTSSEDVWVRRIFSSWSRRLEDVLKTSPEDEDERRLQHVFKTNVCWVRHFLYLLYLSICLELSLFISRLSDFFFFSFFFIFILSSIV